MYLSSPACTTNQMGLPSHPIDLACPWDFLLLGSSFGHSHDAGAINTTKDGGMAFVVVLKGGSLRPAPCWQVSLLLFFSAHDIRPWPPSLRKALN